MCFLLKSGGDCDMGVKGIVLNEGELEGVDCIEDDGGKEDMGVDEREGGCSTAWIPSS